MPPTPQESLRNVAIVAHVDHGKTTLVDHMLRQAGTFRDNEVVAERVMDSNDLERERGITILAKNTSVRWRQTGRDQINIVDTPGHADFGGEVERTLLMADGALLLVDAAEGPLPQTRFVLRKCLELGFPVIVVINKIDRSDARPDEVLERGLRPLLRPRRHRRADRLPRRLRHRQAGHRQAHARRPDRRPSTPLFETILEKIPPAAGRRRTAPLQILVSNVDHDDYVGRLAIGRIVAGTVTRQPAGRRSSRTATTIKGRIKVLSTFEGLKRVAGAGGVGRRDRRHRRHRGHRRRRHHRRPGPRLGGARARRASTSSSRPSRCASASTPRPSPARARQSKYLTSRHAPRAPRCARRGRTSPSASRRPTRPDTFLVLGRGELQLAILVETMRREGYEMQLGNPEVVTREVDGVRCASRWSSWSSTCPSSSSASSPSASASGAGAWSKMANPGFGRARLEYRVPEPRPHRLPRRVPHRDARHGRSSTRCSTAGSPGAAR